MKERMYEHIRKKTQEFRLLKNELKAEVEKEIIEEVNYKS
jgi:hypothetical protein